MRKIIIFMLLSFLNFKAFSNYNVDWSETAKIPLGTNRANIFNLDPKTFEIMKYKGQLHASSYPVNVTGLVIPYKPFINYFNNSKNNIFKKIALEVGEELVGFKTENEFLNWLGLSPFNKEENIEIFKTPRDPAWPLNFYVGEGLIQTKEGIGLTFSCYACHSQSLFGKTILGLTNKRPRANRFFHLGRSILPLMSDALFKLSTKPSDEDFNIFKRTKKNIMATHALIPQTLGLDTSLAHVALALARRNEDEYATKNPLYEKYPRYNELEREVADSKPMPWWNLKYKTRWLSDGSVVSGNPILTNILWNEIGRGADLFELENWMIKNQQTIDELTVAAFATEAPKWTDFFKANTINLEKAKKGEIIFNQTCKKCHGEYQKGWSLSNEKTLTDEEKLSTVKVLYSEQTLNKDVGTDPKRSIGISAFSESLNQLAISKWMKTKVEAKKGYVPPPLVGIWSRYPYMHNNSIPNLCALLTNPKERPTFFIQGKAIDINKDYDADCVGYPVGNKIPKNWRTDNEAFYFVGKSGMSNTGHFKMIQKENGEELLSLEEKMQLIEFLKTL